MICGDLNRKEIEGGVDGCICIADSLCLQQKLTQHCKGTVCVCVCVCVRVCVQSLSHV